MFKLRKHQKEALNSVQQAIKKGKGSALGRVVIPTGGGKTFIEASVIKHQIEKYSNNKIHVVLAPRILLANQLIGEFRKFLGYNFRAIAFHSGHFEPEDEQITWKESNTTQVNEVKEAHKNAMKMDQPLIVFSTYHSSERLEGIEFDTLLADESQYCVAENFGSFVQKISARVKIFFTATEKFTSSDRGKGLNNTSVFGERLYYISPKELIDLGLIVPPRMHIMYGETKDEDKAVINEIVEIAVEQDKLTRETLDFSKILFAMKGTDDVKTVEDNIKKIKKALPEHDVFTITSKNGARIDNVQIKREQFLEELKDRKNCLIFHYDILSEGIDVDGITGVVLLRNLGLAKLLQTIGRAVRIYKPAPELKKQAWISVPVINGDEDDKERVRYFIETIRLGGNDISAEDVVETGKPRHQSEDQDIDDAYGKTKNNFSSLFITDIMHEIEENEFWNEIRSETDTDKKLDLLFKEEQ